MLWEENKAVPNFKVSGPALLCLILSNSEGWGWGGLGGHSSGQKPKRSLSPRREESGKQLTRKWRGLVCTGDFTNPSIDRYSATSAAVCPFPSKASTAPSLGCVFLRGTYLPDLSVPSIYCGSLSSLPPSHLRSMRAKS